MKFSRIRISSRSAMLLGSLKHITGLTPNITARFAFCMSLKERSIPNPDEYNEEGTEISPTVLFGDHEKIYHTLMINRLKKDKLDPELYLNKMTRAHINRGVIALHPRIKHLSDFYELIQEERDV